MSRMLGIMRLILLGVGFWLATAYSLPQEGEPVLTAQTARTGGPIDADQAKLVFDQADLSFEIFPGTQRLTGVARLTFTAKAPLSTLVVDLDRNLGPTSVSIGDKALPTGAFSN